MTISTWLVLFIKNAQPTCLSTSCKVLTATNTYGKVRTGKCFQVSVPDLKQIIVHQETTIVGLTFNFVNGTSTDFMEKASIKSYTIDLDFVEIKGVNLKVGEGVESLQFQLLNSSSNAQILTEMIGDSPNGCLFQLNSNFLNVLCIQINTIYGCVDDKNSSYFPYIAFDHHNNFC